MQDPQLPTEGEPGLMPHAPYDPKVRFLRLTTEGPMPEARPDLGPCLLWTSECDPRGYGFFRPASGRHKNSGRVAAHRFAYEAFVGPIPDGMELDHLCRVRNCVRVHHLEPVPHRVNTLRGQTITGSNASKTHCKHGHSLENAYIHSRPDGRKYRRCRTCCEVRALRLRGTVVTK